jgi:hypothetical protein
MDRERSAVWQAIARRALSLLSAGLVVAGAAYAIHRQRAAELRLFQEQEAASREQRSAQAAAWAVLATRGDLPAALARCRQAWEGELSLHHDPIALAYTRDALTAYFQVGADPGSVRRVECGARGVSLGMRVAHPLQGLLPAEAAASGAETDAEDDARSELRRLASLPLAAGEAAIELVADPVRGRVWQRHWWDDGPAPRSVRMPADAPAFPLLADSPWLRALEGAPPAPRPLKRHDWLAETEAAFDLVARSLPRLARVSELTLEADAVKLQIESSTPAFDGRPPAPLGEKSFDEYGIADLEWWYPREEAGFGCRPGEALDRVRTAFATARGSVAGGRLSQAWWSCSTAFGDGRTGVWHLRPAP